MTTRIVRPYEPDDLWLLPPSPQEGLPADHLVYFVSDLVEELALRPILQTYGGVTRGPAPSHPRLLVKVLLYAYAGGWPRRARWPGNGKRMWRFACWPRTSDRIFEPSVTSAPSTWRR